VRSAGNGKKLGDSLDDGDDDGLEELHRWR
jgi:hypothetical protein